MNAKRENNFLEERANKLMENLWYYFGSNGTVDSIKLANSFGFEIVEHNGLHILINGVITSNKDEKQIAININLSKAQKRYIITYLLSTYLLYNKEQEFFTWKHIDNEEDYDAAYFARLLLISEKKLLFFCSKYRIIHNKINNIEIKTLANIFEILPDVMEKKIEDLRNKYTPSKNTLSRKLIK